MSAKRKVIMVSIGNGGNRIATAFLSQLLKDNGVNSSGDYSGPDGEGLEIFCDRQPSGALSPRRILVDLNRDNLQTAQQSEYGGLYNRCVYGFTSSSPYWAAGFFGEGTILVDQALCEIQLKVDQSCGDCIIWVIHTLGGGCGSGVGSLLLDLLATQLPKVPRVSIAILPSSKVSDGVTEPYNAGLALDHILSSAHQVLLIDNEKLYDICFKGRIPSPTYNDLNNIVSKALATLVSPLIWPCADGQRMTVEAFHAALRFPPKKATVPWHDLKANQIAAQEKIVSVAAWTHALGSQSPRVVSANELAKASYNEATSLLTPATGKWIRNLSIMNGLEDSVGSFFTGSTTLIANSASGMLPRRAAAAGIHTGVADSLLSLLDKFSTLFRPKRFLNYYTNLGANEMNFMEAESRLGSLATAVKALTNPIKSR